jgi:hypothetical protein
VETSVTSVTLDPTPDSNVGKGLAGNWIHLHDLGFILHCLGEGAQRGIVSRFQAHFFGCIHPLEIYKKYNRYIFCCVGEGSLSW